MAMALSNCDDEPVIGVIMKKITSMTTFEIDYWKGTSLRGMRSKGKGKGIWTRDHERGRREEGNACKEAIVFAIPPTN